MLCVLMLGGWVSVVSGSHALTAPENDEEGKRVHAPRRSIYQVSPLVDGLIIGAAGALTIVDYAVNPSIIEKRCPCDREEVNVVDRSVIGNHSGNANWAVNVTLGVFLVGLPVLDLLLDVGWSEVWLEDLVVYAEALAINALAVSITKTAVQRPFPETYEGLPHAVNSASGYRSFYSGHTAIMTSAVTTAALTYTWRHGGAAWPWIVAGVFTASVAAELIISGQHFYSDIAVGAIVGAGSSYLVALLHRRGDRDEQFAVMPTSNGWAAVYARRF